MGGSATLQMVARASRTARLNGKLHEPGPFYLARLQALSPIWEDLRPYKTLEIIARACKMKWQAA